MLDRSLWLEALIRDHWRADETAKPIESAKAIFNRYRSKKGAEARLIVDQCVNNPLELADFYSLGDLKNGLRYGSELEKLVTDLLHFRNVLAHGHAVGWRAHEELERLETRAARL